jgi:hypothetical protein
VCLSNFKELRVGALLWVWLEVPRTQVTCTDCPMTAVCPEISGGWVIFLHNNHTARRIVRQAGSTRFYKPIVLVKHDATVCSYHVWQGEHVSLHPHGTGRTSSTATHCHLLELSLYASPRLICEWREQKRGRACSWLHTACYCSSRNNRDGCLLGCNRSRSCNRGLV